MSKTTHPDLGPDQEWQHVRTMLPTSVVREPRPDPDPEAAVRDGRQLAAFHAIVEELQKLPAENQVRVLASITILFGHRDDITRRIARTEK